MNLHSILSGAKVYYVILWFSFEALRETMDFYNFLKKE